MALLLGGALIPPAGATAAVLYDQTTGTAGLSLQSAHRTTPDGYDSDAADDFTVPDGVLWTLTSIDVEGQETSTAPATFVLFADGGTQPAGQLFRQGGIPFPLGDTGNLPLTGAPPLPPGHYWLSVYTTYSSGPFYWRAQDPVSGSPAVWENPQNASLTGCTTYKPFARCFTLHGNDLMFRLNGYAAPITHRRKCQKRHKHRRAATAKKKRCKKRRR